MPLQSPPSFVSPHPHRCIMFHWISLRRTVSLRALIVLLLISVLGLSLCNLAHPRFHSPLGHHLAVRFDPPGWKQGGPPLAKHILTPDGLLHVNPDGPHPIFQLIRDAEAAWEAKRARASKTLGDAVLEYKRRYRRAPPLGFDKWYVVPAITTWVT